ncbi:MAG: hypothetical protein L0H79_16330, partial [Intrasporangium sp.]|uniref:Dph6-related ATP pyrophosphatase n=1 Tax=Intrasporangium sp. TaxID=1925024 RepID=UPI002647FA5C
MSRQVCRAALHWSGGKDSAMALSALIDEKVHDACGRDVVLDRLVTTVHSDRNTSTVHGVPVELLAAQADSIGLPLETIPLPGPGLDGYAEAMAATARRLRSEGIEAFAFGDLSSSGVLRRKQAQFAPFGIEVLVPLWGQSSQEVIARFLRSGLAAVTIVVDASVLDRSDVGVPLDGDFLARLPDGVDVCGELGEYHSFVHDGPIFGRHVPFHLDEPRFLERVIGTTEGPRRFAYWLATPQPGRDEGGTADP